MVGLKSEQVWCGGAGVVWWSRRGVVEQGRLWASMVSQPAWESAPAIFYGGAFDVAVIWGLPPPLLTVRCIQCEVDDAYH